MTSETEIVRQVILEASKMGDRLWRQNTGQGWIGKAKVYDRRTVIPMMVFEAGDVLISNARPFQAGFPGLSDTGGYAMITVTPDMVGRKLPIISQPEVKTATGRIRPEQQKFIDHIRSVGGIAGIVRSPQDYRELINGYGNTNTNSTGNS